MYKGRSRYCIGHRKKADEDFRTVFEKAVFTEGEVSVLRGGTNLKDINTKKETATTALG